jgi:transforming growth factor-beta-induced protein
MQGIRRFAACGLASASLLAACGSKDNIESAPAGTSADTATTLAAPATSTAPESTEPSVTTAAAATTMAAATTAGPATTAAPVLGSIIDVAGQDGTFTMLLAALDAAGMTDMLTTGQYTLIAPNNEAFSALGQPAIDALLADPAQLTALLQNHLLPTAEDLNALLAVDSVITVGGGTLDIFADDGMMIIAGAELLTADIAADNGYIHVIDRVLMPKAG